MVSEINRSDEYLDIEEETEVYEHNGLTLDERVGILMWYFDNRTINNKPYEWLIDEHISQGDISKISSIALWEFCSEWNENLSDVEKYNNEEPQLNAKTYLVLSKASINTCKISREYHEGGLITIEDSLELYRESKAINDILDIFATSSVFTRNGDYIWKY